MVNCRMRAVMSSSDSGKWLSAMCPDRRVSMLGRFETGAHFGAEGSLEILGGSSTSETGLALLRFTVTSH